jgi:acetylornithine/N-succinyldiaminopimelate aminotransferase
MKLDQIRAAEAKLLLSTYDRNPILFVGGEGVHIIDENGTKYLDLLSGIGVNALGYNHPVIEEAIARQSRALIHTSNLFYHEGQAELALRLTERTGLDRVFFANTGTEAWEGALKLARAYAGLQAQRRQEDRHEVSGAGAELSRPHLRLHVDNLQGQIPRAVRPVVPGVEFVRFNDVADLRAKFSGEVCAILVEAIQGEGGIRPLTQEFFAEARALASSTGALLIVDEIQAGMGRTGKWCAYQHYGIQPDVTTLAKPLAGGIPLGACCALKKWRAPFTPACTAPPLAAARWPAPSPSPSSTHIEKEGLLAHATEVGDYFQSSCAGLAPRHEPLSMCAARA